MKVCGDDTLRTPLNLLVDCKVPFLFPLIKVSPISNLLSSSLISKIGK